MQSAATPSAKPLSISFKRDLDELASIKDPHRRGRQFEPFLAQLLEAEGFDVISNPKTAAPRQTDLSAQRDSIFFLVEAKWLRLKMHVGHVSAVRERLRKVPEGTFACIFSMSGYTSQAVAEACLDRKLEILLFCASEVREIAAGHLSFNDLLERKRHEFRTNAKAWFSELAPNNSWSRISSEPQVIQAGNEIRRWWRSNTGDNDLIFSTELLDLDALRDGSGASLRLRLKIEDLDDLQRLLRLFKKQLKLAGQDSFAIHQRDVGWYGLGVDDLLSAIHGWKQRYSELNWKTYHHSEEIAYFDNLEHGGILCLTCRQRVGDNAYLHSSHVEMWTPGILVDMSGIRRVCELTANPYAAIERLSKRPVVKHRFSPPPQVNPVAKVISKSLDGRERAWTSGLIVENPFHGRVIASKGGKALDSPLELLSTNEFLFCRLRHQHPATFSRNKYWLRYAEGCWIESRPVIYVDCDWE